MVWKMTLCDVGVHKHELKFNSIYVPLRTPNNRDFFGSTNRLCTREVDNTDHLCVNQCRCIGIDDLPALELDSDVPPLVHVNSVMWHRAQQWTWHENGFIPADDGQSLVDESPDVCQY